MVSRSQLEPVEQAGNRGNSQGQGGSSTRTIKRSELETIEEAPTGGANATPGSQGRNRSQPQGRPQGRSGGRSGGRQRSMGEQVGPAPGEGEPRRLGDNRWLDDEGTEWTSREEAQRASERNETGEAPPAFGSTRSEEVQERSPLDRHAQGMDQFYDAVFPTFESERQGGAATGAMTGGAIGSTLGPIGTLTGSALGAGIGSSAVYAKQTFFDEEVDPSVEEIADDTTNQMVNEALWSGGFMTAGPVFGETMSRVLQQKSLTGRVSDNVRQAKEAADTLQTRGFQMSPIVAARASWARSIPNVTGVLPFGGGKGLRNRLREEDRTLERIINDDVNRILREDLDGDTPNMSLNALGVNIEEAARNSREEWRQIAQDGYDAFYQLARDKGDPAIADIRNVTQAANSGLRQINRNERNRKPLEQLIGENRRWEDVDRLARESNKQRVTNMREIQREISDLLKGVNRSDDPDLYDTLSNMKNEADNAVASVPDPELSNAITHANQTYGYMMSMFENSDMVRQMERADPNAFRQRAGFDNSNAVISEDQIARNMMYTKSPQSVRSLKQVVGPSMTRQLGGRRVQEAIQDARVPTQDGNEVIDWEKFRSNLDLDSVEGREVLGEFFESSPFGQKVQDAQEIVRAAQRVGIESDEGRRLMNQFRTLQNDIKRPGRVSHEDLSQETNQTIRFLDNVSTVGKSMQEIDVRNPSDFLARRLTLGGPSSLGIGAAAAGGGAAAAGTGGAAVAGGGFLGTYALAAALSNGFHGLLRNKPMQRTINKAIEGDHAQGDLVQMGDGSTAYQRVNKGRELQDAVGTMWEQMSPGERTEYFAGFEPLIATINGTSVDEVMNEDDGWEKFANRYQRLERRNRERRFQEMQQQGENSWQNQRELLFGGQRNN